MLRPAQIIVTEGYRYKPLSMGIAHFTGSWATHAFIATVGGEAVEAKLPRVRTFRVEDRIRQLHRENRAYAVLDIPSLPTVQRLLIAQKATSYVGRFYDVGQLALFAVTGKFWGDGAGTVVCSRLITASFRAGANTDLFPAEVLATYPPKHRRLDNLRDGYATPVDLLRSRLEVVDFVPSTRIKTIEEFRR